MNLSLIFIIAGLIGAIASAFTRFPLWVAVMFIGIGLVLGLR